jgi:hypothetical protein
VGTVGAGGNGWGVGVDGSAGTRKSLEYRELVVPSQRAALWGRRSADALQYCNRQIHKSDGRITGTYPRSRATDHGSRITRHRITNRYHKSQSGAELLSRFNRPRSLSLRLSVSMRLSVRLGIRMFGRTVAWRRDGRSGVDRR